MAQMRITQSGVQHANIRHGSFQIKGRVASQLVCLPPDLAVWVQALARDIVLCSWARHLALTVPLYTQVYKWVLASLILGVALRWTSIPSRGSRNIPSSFMPQKPEVSTSLMGYLAHIQILPLPTHIARAVP